jgi:hypothetical protein
MQAHILDKISDRTVIPIPLAEGQQRFDILGLEYDVRRDIELFQIMVKHGPRSVFRGHQQNGLSETP